MLSIYDEFFNVVIWGQSFAFTDYLTETFLQSLLQTAVKNLVQSGENIDKNKQQHQNMGVKSMIDYVLNLQGQVCWGI